MHPHPGIIQQDEGPADHPVNFGAWAPHVMGHLQRIESSLSLQLRTLAVLETKFDNLGEKIARLEERVSSLESARVQATVLDASRVGIVTGIRWLWGVGIAFGSAIVGMGLWIIAHLPPSVGK